ncbi:MAG: HD domain-containing protein [Rhodospirillaceae bacterium]|nr:HD domain-containing protein [Rhodospirillaceae bacterium]
MHRPKILIACQDQATRQRFTESVRFRYRAVAVEDGWLALHLINTSQFSAMVITERLESLNGLDVAYSVRESHRNAHIPIMLVAQRITTRIREMIESGIVDCCIDETAETGAFLFEFNAMCGAHAESAWSALDADIEHVLRTTRNTYKTVFSENTTDIPMDSRLLSAAADTVVDAVRNGRITAVMKALQTHDDYTFVHSLSVAAVLAFFGREIGIRDGDLGIMAQAGFAHDFGKRTTPQAILYKPGLLDTAQMVVIRRHAQAAGDILRRSDGIPAEVINVAERHHERLNGTGYPNGLHGAEIDDLSMVAAIGDVFSALIDNRCYKPRYAPQEAIRMLRDMAGPHLEPHHVAKFVEVMHDTDFASCMASPLTDEAAAE